MKTLFGTTALVIALAAPSFAQETAAPATPAQTSEMTSPYLAGVDAGVRASDFIGKRVYVTEADTSSMSATAMAAPGTDWEDAGEISDLIISLNGDSEAVLVDFGGFLGMGEKTVAVSMANLVMVPDADSPDDYFIVFNGSKATLEAAPAFDPDMVFDATATTADQAMTTAPATPNTSDSMADMGGDMVDYGMMTEADLVGKRVIGPNNEDVGEISAVTLGADNKITAAVVDVGGFLGIGEKPVALGSEMLRLVPDADGNGSSLRVSMTQEQLETLPTYTN